MTIEEQRQKEFDKYMKYKRKQIQKARKAFIKKVVDKRKSI